MVSGACPIGMGLQEGEKMSGKPVKKIILYSLVISFLLAAAGLAVIRHMIVTGLDENIAIAQAAHPHPGDNVAALIDYVNEESHTFRKRNLAVWALGQLRSDRALGTLEKHYTGRECNHNAALCQSELDKAIELCRNQSPDILMVSKR